MNNVNLRRSLTPQRATLAVAGIAALGLVTTPVITAPAPAFAAEAAGDCTPVEVSSDVWEVSHGHQDLRLYGSGGDVRIGLFDDAHSDPDAPLGDHEFVIRVADSLRQDISSFGLADAPGEAWVLPQVQDHSVPWFGFSTTELDQSVLGTGDTATIGMELGSGPGRVIGWQPEGIGNLSVVLDTNDPEQGWAFPGNTHSHTGFIFTEPGAYELVFTYTLADGESYALRSLFLVGDDASVDDFTGACSTATGSGATSAGGGAPGNGKNLSPTAQLAKDIKAIDKELGALSKNVDKAYTAAENFAGVGKSGSKDGKGEKGATSKSAGDKARGKAAGAGEQAGQQAGQQPEGQGAHEGAAGSAGREGSRADAASGNASRTAGGSTGGTTRAGRSASAGAPAGTAAGENSGHGGARSGDAAAKAGAPAIGEAPAQEDAAVFAAPAPASFQVGTTGFWAGIMAGVGAGLLLLGGGLMSYVFFLRRGR